MGINGDGEITQCRERRRTTVKPFSPGPKATLLSTVQQIQSQTAKEDSTKSIVSVEYYKVDPTCTKHAAWRDQGYVLHRVQTAAFKLPLLFQALLAH